MLSVSPRGPVGVFVIREGAGEQLLCMGGARYNSSAGNVCLISMGGRSEPKASCSALSQGPLCCVQMSRSVGWR